MRLLAIAVVAVAVLPLVGAFTSTHPTRTYSSGPTPTGLFLPQSNKPIALFSFLDAYGDRESPGEAMLRSRTCIRNFLTQRAIQSFMFLLNTCRDPHTVTWLQSHFHVDNLANFHGTGAFNTTLYPEWDSVLIEMLSKPKEVVVIKSRRRREGGQGGWRGQIGTWAGGTPPTEKKTKKNPHLREFFRETELEIDPVSLMSRIISVREQLAREFTKDFETIMSANNEILASYHENQETARSSEENELQKQQDEDEDSDDSDEENGDTTMTVPYSDKSSSMTKDDKPEPTAFDKFNAGVLLSNSMDDSSSPLRKGNFDLMLLLATQESIHRVLRSYATEREEREVSFEWFKEFYLKRVGDFFDGHQAYGRADDFLEELLLTPPMLKNMDGGGKKEMVGLIDPLRIAEDIIERRSEVAQEWKAIVKGAPEEHVDLRRHLLARQMGKDIEMSIIEDQPSVSENIMEGFE